MAIFIIDQFSLNTDLPLDIRYVPDSSGAIYNGNQLIEINPDISVYKYPGMQVYDTSTELIWYADNNLQWVPVGSGADASINEILNLITDLSTYITNNVDVSISNLYQITNQLDASIQRIDVSLNDYGSLLAIHDVSIGDLYSQIGQLEASIGDINAYQAIQDASILANTTDILQIEASIGDINAYQVIQDGSIAANEADILQIEASIGDINAYQVIQDGSIAANEADILQIEASIGDINAYQSIQDASILYNDSSIQQLFNEIAGNDASINELYQYNTIQDGSISANQQSITIIDGSITYLTNITNIHDASIGDLYDYNAIQDASILAIEASLGDYVKKSGDTMTGSLIIDASLQVNNTAAFLGNVDIGGNLVVDGSFIYAHTTVLDISTAFIELNTGLTGPPPSWLQSGIIVQRGDASSYAIVYDETAQTFRVGIVNGPDASGTFDDSETQAVATREDAPIVDGVAVWNDAEKRFDTFGGFTFTTVGGLDLDSSLKLDAYAPGTTSMLVVQPNGYVSVQTIPNYDASIANLYSYIDGSLLIRDASITQNILDILQIEASIADINADILQIEASLADINSYQVIQDGSIAANTSNIAIIDGSITYLTNITNIHDISIGNLYDITDALDASIIRIDASIVDLYNITNVLEASIVRIDGSINDIYDQLIAQDTSVKGAINIGDGSAAVYAGITNDGSLQFREFVGVGAAIVTENGDLIEISIDASFGGEVNTASNIGTGEGVFAQKVAQDLEFKSISTNDPSTVIITSDLSTLYIDVSIDAISDASLVGLTDTSIDETQLVTHTNIEYDASQAKWVETQNNWWDVSLATTATDIDGVPAGTVLNGETLKEILFRILYAYQLPIISATGLPAGGTYEKGLTTTVFPDVSISYSASNANYPLAKLNNLYITKTGVGGNLFEASLGLIDSSAGTYTDNTGITNWGGTTRTINYNVYIEDDEDNQGSTVFDQVSYTFYYRQYWGTVDGNTNVNQVDSSMISNLANSRLAGESDLNATFVNPGSGFIKYLFAYPDTVASPDNFGLLSEIIDQNDFDITDSFNTENEDVSVGNNNVRYRFYLLKNKVDTATFDITFKF